MREKINKFIIDNGLSFKEGSRNYDSTILSGYALSLGAKNTSIMRKCIDTTCVDSDDYYSELDRVFSYAKRRDYGKFWSTPEAKDKYIF